MVKKKSSGVKKRSDSNNEKVEQSSKVSKKNINYWMIATAVLSLVLVIGIIYASTSGVSKKTAEKKFLEFVELQGADVNVLGVKSVGGLYEVSFEFMGEVGEYHVSKDGKYVGSMVDLNEFKSMMTGDAVQDTPRNLVKSDKPSAELFIMTHCPYGTQAEKGFIPMIESMGNKIDAKIRFVHYFMHDPEYTETPIQLCIREEQSDKFMPYLKCFLEGDGIVNPNYGLIMEGKDSSLCMKEVGVDEKKVNECVSSKRWETYYNEDSVLSQSYGVQGSPTLVVNGVQVSSGRDPNSYLSTVCGAFNNAPSECSTLFLSTATPDPYFGWTGESEAYGAGGLC